MDQFFPVTKGGRKGQNITRPRVIVAPIACLPMGIYVNS